MPTISITGRSRSQYHPDKNPSVDAEEKFKEIRYGGFLLVRQVHLSLTSQRCGCCTFLYSKAYQVLSDPVCASFSSSLPSSPHRPRTLTGSTMIEPACSLWQERKSHGAWYAEMGLLCCPLNFISLLRMIKRSTEESRWRMPLASLPMCSVVNGSSIMWVSCLSYAHILFLFPIHDEMLQTALYTSIAMANYPISSFSFASLATRSMMTLLMIDTCFRFYNYLVATFRSVRYH